MITMKELPTIFWIGLLLLVVSGGWVFKSYLEAHAFNRVTGANVSTWDALWIELRVQEGGKP